MNRSIFFHLYSGFFFGLFCHIYMFGAVFVTTDHIFVPAGGESNHLHHVIHLSTHRLIFVETFELVVLYNLKWVYLKRFSINRYVK